MGKADERNANQTEQRVQLMQYITDPKFFNYLIMTLYLMNCARWLVHGNYADVCYWLSAFAITATVTFGYQH
jgi:steroid 5-alpha reductase family enzyme